MERRIFMSGWKKLLPYDNHEPRYAWDKIEVTQKGMKIIYICRRYTQQLPILYHSSYINMPYQHNMVLIKWVG